MTKKLSSVKSSGLKFRSLDTVACVIKQVAIFWLSSCATSTDKILEKVKKVILRKTSNKKRKNILSPVLLKKMSVKINFSYF